MKVLNLYAGLGGNRMLWKDCEVTAVESDTVIAAEYSLAFPLDTVIIADAHQFLLDHYSMFDFIWSSFPCLSHSRFNLTGSGGVRYPDMGLYQEILLLKSFFKGKWVVENVDPYYDPLIRGVKISRHLFWSNFYIPDIRIEFPGEFYFASLKALQDWLGVSMSAACYQGDRIKRRQAIRNCVHPALGLHVLESSKKNIQSHLFA